MLMNDLDWIIARLQRMLPEHRLLLTDHTKDPEAITGWASGRYAKGYKLHVVIDGGNRLLGWRVESMNKGETPTCRKIVEGFPRQRRKRIMVGDAGYSSNQLHGMSASRNIRLIAPRARPGTGLGWRRHHRDRLSSVRLTEDRGGWMWPMLRSMRIGVERYFSGLVTSCVGAGHLPSWVRSLRRTRLWIGAKLAINAARIVRNQRLHA